MTYSGKVYTLKTGKYFGDAGTGFAIPFIVLGLILFPWGLLFAFIGLYFMLTSYGVKIDTASNRLMHYVNHFGFLTAGHWIENKIYTQICILGSTSRQQGGMGYAANISSARVIKIFLLDQYHVKRIELMEAGTVSEAETLAREISEKTGFPVVAYNPVQLSKNGRK